MQSYLANLTLSKYNKALCFKTPNTLYNGLSGDVTITTLVTCCSSIRDQKSSMFAFDGDLLNT